MKNGEVARATVFLSLTLCSSIVHAAEYPERQITAIVPYAAGSTTDIIARIISPPLSKALGQQVIVVNRAGADGRIGAEAMAKAAPDGYTIAFNGGAMSLTPAVRKNVPWDPVPQVQPVAQLGGSPYIIAVNPSVPANNLAAFLNIAKKFPGKLNASIGGDATGMALALFQIRSGVRAEAIAYKGTGLAGVAVASGEVDFAILNVPAWVPFIPSRRVRALAVSSEKRLPAFPDIPTTEEAGLRDFKEGAMFGIYMTGGSPIGAARRINAEVNKLLAMPEIIKSLTQAELEPNPKSVEQFTRIYLDDLAKWKEVVSRGKIPLMD